MYISNKFTLRMFNYHLNLINIILIAYIVSDRQGWLKAKLIRPFSNQNFVQ